MALAEVIEWGPATVEVEPMPGKCGDCFGTGGVLDVDGSLTGVVGQPVACGCMAFDGCQRLAHRLGCECCGVVGDVSGPPVPLGAAPVSGGGWPGVEVARRFAEVWVADDPAVGAALLDRFAAWDGDDSAIEDDEHARFIAADKRLMAYEDWCAEQGMTPVRWRGPYCWGSCSA